MCPPPPVLHNTDVCISFQHNPFKDRILQVFSSKNDGLLSLDDFINMASVFCDAASRSLKTAYAFRIYGWFSTHAVTENWLLLMQLWLVSPEAFVMTTYGTTSDDKVGTTTTLGFQMSHYPQLNCLSNSLSRLTTYETSKVCITGPLRECIGNRWIPIKRGSYG